MQIHLVASVTFPIICGPTFAVIYRAIELSKYYTVNLYLPRLIGQDETDLDIIIRIRIGNVPLNLHLHYYQAINIAGKHVFVIPISRIFLQMEMEKDDVIILEEPEHILPVLYLIDRIPSQRMYGIIHTNYIGIIKSSLRNYFDSLVEKIYLIIFNFIFSRYSMKSLAISPALNYYQNSVYLNIHGISNKYLKDFNPQDLKPTFYFMGQLVRFLKNLDLLKELVNLAKIQVDVYGKGADRYLIDNDPYLNLKGTISNHDLLRNYRTYISTSLNEGLCTATLEAIAMNKFVIIPEGLCNQSLINYPNVLFYSNQLQFLSQIQYAQNNLPEFISLDFKKQLGWEYRTKILEEYIKSPDDIK
jgi:glycosyltransferase involved in cell wall biosynthesis